MMIGDFSQKKWHNAVCWVEIMREEIDKVYG